VLASEDMQANWAVSRTHVFQSGRANPTREIVLHLCTLSGREGTGSPGTRPPAHYNVLLAKHAGRRTSGHWPIDPHESDAQRRQRHALLWEQCKAAVLENAARWQTNNRINDENSMRLIRTMFGTGLDPSGRHAF